MKSKINDKIELLQEQKDKIKGERNQLKNEGSKASPIPFYIPSAGPMFHFAFGRSAKCISKWILKMAKPKVMCNNPKNLTGTEVQKLF